MRMPDKTYLTFAEVAERWNVTVDHIEQWVWEQHLLRAVVRLEGLKGFTGNTQDGWVEGNFHIRLKYLDNNDLVEKYSHKHVYVANPIPRDEKQNDLRNFYIKSAATALIVALGKSAEEVTHYEHEEHGLSKFMEDDYGNTLVWDIWMDTKSLKQAGAVFLQTPFFLWIEEVKIFEDKNPDLVATEAKSSNQKPRKSLSSDAWKAEIKLNFLLNPTTYDIYNALEYIRSSIERPDSIFNDIEEAAISSIDDIQVYLHGKQAPIKAKTIRNFISNLNKQQK